jgi:hypothetical protein
MHPLSGHRNATLIRSYLSTIRRIFMKGKMLFIGRQVSITNIRIYWKSMEGLMTLYMTWVSTACMYFPHTMMKWNSKFSYWPSMDHQRRIKYLHCNSIIPLLPNYQTYCKKPLWIELSMINYGKHNFKSLFQLYSEKRIAH